MMRRRLLLACLALVTSSVCAAPNASFLLTAIMQDLENYFPGQLGNGYVSTLTAPRGTEGNLAYLAAFMDYTDGDVSRPAAVPGWTEINYRAGSSWLNQVDVTPAHFQSYRQILDMYDGTLTTSYRYLDGTKATDIKVTTLVSQASPHLAATQLSITPDFDGEVELSFAFNLWAPHQPRFALAKLNGDRLMEALAANNLSLQPAPPATADRAAWWYHGDTHVVASGHDAQTLTLWLNGHAERGAQMAEAAAIALPQGMQASDISFQQDDYRLAFNVRVAVQKGRTYAFTKYVALSRDAWGGDAKQDLVLATQARAQGFDALLQHQAAAWHALWQSDIVIDGDPKAQQIVHSDLYYLLSNTTVGTAWPMGACALTPNYAGHAFWDSDSWVFPALLLLHPERAKPIVMFRHRTMQPARERAIQYGAKGTMYPWEADPQTGVDNTPHFAYGVYREIHVNADIAIAQWQYYLASGDKAWLKQNGWPVIREIAQFWASRVTYNKAADRYEIMHVTSPDEAYDDVPNDSFTNAAARKALNIAIEAAKTVGEPADPQWSQIADKMYIPFLEKEQRHLDFDQSVPHDKITWMGSSLAWLMYPNLDLPMSETVRRNDFDFQLHELKVHGDDPNEMMMVMLAVGASELGDAKTAGDWIQRNLVGFLKPPFNVRTETVANNAGYILATSSGFLQSMIYGLTGLRIDDKGLDAAYAPVLPPGWTSLKLQRVSFRGKQYDITVTRDAGGKAVLTRTAL